MAASGLDDDAGECETPSAVAPLAAIGAFKALNNYLFRCGI